MSDLPVRNPGFPDEDPLVADEGEEIEVSDHGGGVLAARGDWLNGEWLIYSKP